MSGISTIPFCSLINVDAEKQSTCSNWDTEWPKLEAAVRAIHECRAYGATERNGEFISNPSVAVALPVERERYHSYEELYRSVENLCTTKLEPMLYTKLRALCEEYTTRLVLQLHRYGLSTDYGYAQCIYSCIKYFQI